MARFRATAKAAVIMGLSNAISRLTAYYQRHGVGATLRRAQVASHRALFAGRMVVFYCDLDEGRMRPVSIPTTFAVKRVRALAELSAESLQEMTSFWNPKVANRNMRERFEKGASLWLVESENQLVGYGWTLEGKTIAPYYFPLGPDDVQLFDFYVFPRFRGRAIHWFLTSYILLMLAAEGRSRAFADTGEWNQAQLASFTMTPFRRLGFARSFCMFGRRFTRWVDAKPPIGHQNALTRRAALQPSRGSHER
jgi:ribosomal protein S18 acetylase RimI-like enzyme